MRVRRGLSSGIGYDPRMIPPGSASAGQSPPRPQQTEKAPMTATPPSPLRETIPAEWMLDPSINFLNHGCYGARPRAVAEAQQRLRDRFEASPVQDLHFGRDRTIPEAKRVVGSFIGAKPDDFGFVSNATGGVNAVLRSLTFSSGDELLTISHVYNAVRMTMRYLGEHIGAKPIETRVPLPVDSPAKFVSAIEDALTERTKLVIIDHVTSPTALLLPVRDIVQACEERGVDVLIDGAHAPGMIDLDVEAIGAAYYAGNLHKWACAPVGAAFLWVRPDRQKTVHPLTISHFYEEGFPHEFRWQGTRDISPWLAAAEAIVWMDERYSWANVRRHNHQMAVWAQQMLCEKWGVEPSSPIDGSMLGSMATVRLPQSVREKYESAEAFQKMLFDAHRYEVPIVDWDETWWLRVSCQVYNTAEQFERLGEIVGDMC